MRAVCQVGGRITYNGEPFEDFQVARTCAYISQVDEHQAELTVRETFDFAARCLGTGHKQSKQALARRSHTMAIGSRWQDNGRRVFFQACVGAQTASCRSDRIITVAYYSMM